MATLPTRVARFALAALIGLSASAIVVATVGCFLGDGAAWAESKGAGYPPDPPGVPTTKHWLFDVKVDKGVVSLDRVRTVTLRHPEPTPRVMGRYALELWIGSELLDRLRFNVPLGGNLPREDDGRPFKRPSFDKVTARFAVRMGDQPRATYLKLVDRATGEEQRFIWPPAGEALAPYPAGDAGRDAGSADAGSKDGGPPPKPTTSSRPDAGPPPDAGGAPDGGAPGAGKPGDAPLVPRRPPPAPAPPPPASPTPPKT